MQRSVYFFIFMLVLSSIFLVGCGETEDAAGAAVESYVKALVAEDPDRLSTISCAAWEEQAIMELDAFIGVSASLEGLSCSKVGTENEDVLVECEGAILATYNNEQQELPLDGLTYRVVREAGEWLVCGYQ